MPRLAHRSDQSSPDADGWTHRVYIEPRGSKTCPCKDTEVYAARIFCQMHAPRHNHPVIAKFPLDQSQSRDWIQSRLQRVRAATCVVNWLNHNGDTISSQISFLQLQHATLDERASIFPGKRQKGDLFLFEDKLKPFMRFINVNQIPETRDNQRNQGRRRSTSGSRSSRARRNSCSDQMANIRDPESIDWPDASLQQRLQSHVINNCLMLPHNQLSVLPGSFLEDRPPSYEQVLEEDNRLNQINNNLISMRQRVRSDSESSIGIDATTESHPALHAFVHAFFYVHQGKQAISKLQGTLDEHGNYVLSTPTIHSVDKRYGQTDKGIQGIRQVVESHVCNSMCHQFPSMFDLMTTTSGQSCNNVNVRSDIQCHQQECQNLNDPFGHSQQQPVHNLYLPD